MVSSGSIAKLDNEPVTQDIPNLENTVGGYAYIIPVNRTEKKFLQLRISLVVEF